MKRKKGIKSNTTYTKRYRGSLVEDYGWLSIVKDLRNKFPSVVIESDTPIIAPLSKKLGTSHKLTVFKFPFGKKHNLIANRDPMDKHWYFYDAEKDKSINIYKYLKEIKC